MEIDVEPVNINCDKLFKKKISFNFKKFLFVSVEATRIVNRILNAISMPKNERHDFFNQY